jgi:hypothetical protein
MFTYINFVTSRFLENQLRRLEFHADLYSMSKKFRYTSARRVLHCAGNEQVAHVQMFFKRKNFYIRPCGSLSKFIIIVNTSLPYILLLLTGQQGLFAHSA